MQQGLLGALGKKDSKDIVFTVGVFIAVGAAVTAGKFLYEWAQETVRRTLTVNVEFDSKDESFRWVMEWLADNSYAQKHSGVYICTVGKDTKEPQLTPGEGMHWLNAEATGKWVFVRRISRGRSGGGGSSSVSGRNETLSVTMLGWTRGNIDAFIEECRRRCNEKDRSRTLLYSGGEHGSWNMAQSKLRRPLSSVFLDNHLAEDLQHDALEFLSSENWYAERGIPWRRGYLLSGPPGTGKSSFVRALAGDLGLNIYSVSLGSFGMTDGALQNLMVSAPRRCILLVEDIDAAFRSIDDSEDVTPSKSKLTLSGLLNAIDGVISQEGSLLFLTTNNPDALPDRLVRSGRIDVREEFCLATHQQIRGLFRLYYGNGETQLEESFISLCPEKKFSCSDIQQMLTLHKESPEKAIGELKKRIDH